MKKIFIALLIMALFSAYSCAPSISQEEYDKVSNELSAARSQLDSVQDKLDEAEKLKAQTAAQNGDLSKQKDAIALELKALQVKLIDLSSQKDVVAGELGALQAKYDELNLKYQELSKPPASIVVEELEKEIFRLINVERTGNGLKELTWNDSIYGDAKNNSKSMAANQRIEYPVQVSHRDAWRAAGYADTERTAEAVLMIWKNTEYYKDKFLNSVISYGVIGIYESAGIYNISYIADSIK